MIEEYQSIMKNDVWDVVPRPEGKSVVTSKWIYKINVGVRTLRVFSFGNSAGFVEVL